MASTRKKSKVWDLIEKTGDDKVQCMICKTSFKDPKGSTGTLKQHLERKHPTEWGYVHRSVPQPATISQTSAQVPPMVQPVVMQSVKKAKKLVKDCPRKKELDLLVLQMICQDMQPFSMVSDKGFRNLVSALDPRYHLPDWKTLSQKLLPEAYEEARTELQHDIDQVPYITVSTDIWTSHKRQAYITVTAHFMNADWILQSKVLETSRLAISYTAENLSEALKTIFSNWKIEEKIACVVTDNCPNIVKAVRDLNYLHAPCFAHTLQFVINNSIDACEEIGRLKERVQNIVSYFNSSVKASDRLTELQLQTGRPVRELTQDVESRWNSTFYMIERYIEEHKMVVAALCMLGEHEMCITNDELELARAYIQCLKPFEVATTELCTEKLPTASKAIPVITGLHRSLTKPELQTVSFAQKLQEELHQNFDGWAEDSIHGPCTYLDPRFKKIGIYDNLSALKIEQELTIEIHKLLPTEEPQEFQAQQQQGETDDFLWGHFDAAVKEHTAEKQLPTSQPVNELRRYNEEKHQDRKGDPCEWWRQNTLLLPNLSFIALRYMCIPATSVPAERLFSEEGELFSARRSCLKSETIDMVLFLNKY